MGYKCFFVDNEEYSAADVNNALKVFVTGGIEDPFTDGTAYHVGKLNDMTAVLSTAGIVPETDLSCKCIIDKEEKSVFISKGTVFLNNGTRVVFDVEGTKLTYSQGETNYVYVLFSESENKSYPICSVSSPAESEDFVMLAEISADGTLIDKRKYARGKLPGYQSNAGFPMYIDDDIILNKVSTYKFGPVEYTISLGESSNYSIVVYNCTATGYKFMISSFKRGEFLYLGHYDIKRGSHRSVCIDYEELGVMPGYYLADNDSIIVPVVGYAGNGTGHLKFRMDGSDLKIEISAEWDSTASPENVTIPLKLTIY